MFFSPSLGLLSIYLVSLVLAVALTFRLWNKREWGYIAFMVLCPFFNSVLVIMRMVEYCALVGPFLNGMREFRSDMTSSYFDADQCEAYDTGREFMHRITLRRWDAEPASPTLVAWWLFFVAVVPAFAISHISIG